MRKCWIIPLSFNIMNILLILQEITCHPIENVSADSKPDLKYETRYPNGTVVGRYSYKDEEGNPIAVKYYADRNSYGVELNSLKTFKAIQTSTTNEALQKSKAINDYMKPIEPLLDLASEIMSFSSKHNNFLMGTTEAKMKDVGKASHSHPTQIPEKLAKIGSPDYETFYQNEVKAPKQCEKEKVRVYLVKEKRKVRNALDQADRYCGNF